MINRIDPFHNVGQMAKRVFGPLNSGYKGHDTHNEKALIYGCEERTKIRLLSVLHYALCIFSLTSSSVGLM